MVPPLPSSLVKKKKKKKKKKKRFRSMLPTTKKIAVGRQIHVPVLHHRLPIYEILCAPHPIETTEAPEKKKIKKKKKKKKKKKLLSTQTTRRQKMHKSPPG